MAQLAGTTDTYDTKGAKEDLGDRIYNVNKADTPFLSTIGRAKTVSTKMEWLTDTLAAANANNAFPEGDEYTYADVAAPVRVANYTQISMKTFLISGTLEEVDKAGRDSERKYQAAKKALELKKDQEVILLSAQASNAGAAAGATARRLGGFAAWLTTNVSRGVGGANGGFNTGTGLVAAPTVGTGRAFTETMLKDAQQSAYSAGGAPNILMMGVAHKRTFSAFPGLATSRRETGNRSARIIASADVYVGDFGELAATPNRQMPAGTVLGIDPDFVKMAVLRPMFVDTPAKTGDGLKYAAVVEYTLMVANEAAHFGVFDLT